MNKAAYWCKPTWLHLSTWARGLWGTTHARSMQEHFPLNSTRTSEKMYVFGREKGTFFNM